MDTSNMIEITGVALPELVKAVYDLSRPQGMGFLHFTESPLSDEEATEIIDRSSRGNIALNMDYVKGRACKMAVYTEDNKLYIRDSWFDHSVRDLDELLNRIIAGMESQP